MSFIKRWGNDLSPAQHPANMSINVIQLFFGTNLINFNEIRNKTHWFSFKKMYMQSFANCYPFCSGANLFLLPTFYISGVLCCWSRHNKPVITEPIYQALSVYKTNVYVPSSIWCKVIYHSHIQIYFPTSCLSTSAIFQSIADVNDVIFILF